MTRRRAALALGTILAAVLAGGIAIERARPAQAGTTAAAASPLATAATRALTDEIGRNVRVVEHPARIVSLAPAITECLFAVGAGKQVVGVTRYCDYPPEAKTRAAVGGFADPNVERVAALAPDLVIATSDTVTRERFDALVALGLPVYAVNPRDLAGVAATIRHVGIASGHPDEGEARAKEFEKSVAAVDARVKGAKAVRTLFLFSVDPLIAAGPSTFVDELLRRAGAENVAANAPTSYPRYGLEGILAARPDRILTSVPGAAATLTTMLEGTPLAKPGTVVEVDADLLERPGPRLAEGLARVAAVLHPEKKP